MADKNLDGNGLNEVWIRAAQLVKKYTGEVDLKKGDLQTQVDTKMSGTNDTKDNVVTFTSNDVADPTVWQEVSVMSSNEKHSSLFNKISTMFSNMRYLYKILGSTDISALGSVTQAIATLNGNVGNMKGISSSSAITVQGQYALDAREKNASVEGTLANQISTLNSNLGSKLNGFNNDLVIYDANDFKTNGCIFFNKTCSNIPHENADWIIACITTGSFSIQIAQSYWAYGSVSVYVRHYSNMWSNWMSLNLN